MVQVCDFLFIISKMSVCDLGSDIANATGYWIFQQEKLVADKFNYNLCQHF